MSDPSARGLASATAHSSPILGVRGEPCGGRVRDLAGEGHATTAILVRGRQNGQECAVAVRALLQGQFVTQDGLGVGHISRCSNLDRQ